MNLPVLLAAAALLLGLPALTPGASPPDAPTSPEARVIESSAYIVTITRARRGATVRLEPRRGARPAWRTPLVAGALMTTDSDVCNRRGPTPDGYAKIEWTEFRLSPSDGRRGLPTYEAQARRVDFDAIAGFAVRSEGGNSWIFVCEGMPPQSQANGDNPPSEDPPKDDPPTDGDPPSDDPPSDGDPPADDDDGPCNGIVDPWTGECTPDVRNPWPEDERTGEQIVLSM
ncbi:MAG: hypothetical protein AAF845_02030 [Bacteroidota bacterium]